MRRIYLDYAATSPLAPAAEKAMKKVLDSGNPSSLYAEGRAGKAALDEARENVSRLLGGEFAETIFTSGGTEAANLAIIGSALQQDRRDTILLGTADHHCVINTQKVLERLGYKVQFVPVDCEARTDLDALESLISERVLLVSIMHANNEVGTIQPVREIAAIAHRFGAIYHCDAVQTFGKSGIWTSVSDLDADLVSVSAHKLGGPKGVGALWMRAGVKVTPLIAGGGQEREVRGGTENVAGICGFGAVCTHTSTPEKPPEILLKALVELGAERTVKAETPHLTGHVHVRFPGLSAETVLIRLDREGVSASSGAACSSGSVEPSHVLIACGYSLNEAKEGLRFTFGPSSTVDDATEAAQRIASAIKAIREA